MRLYFYLLPVTVFALAGCTPAPVSEDDQQRYTPPSLVEIQSGNFIQGDQTLSGDADERPAHLVQFKKNFRISTYEITENEFFVYASAAGKSVPSNWQNSRKPVTQVSWQDAKDYAKWLSGVTDRRFRLPSESEWEYAASVGGMHYTNTNNATEACQFGNISDQTAHLQNGEWEYTECNDAQAGISEVGQYSPNNHGLYDALGNVWEWTLDCYTSDYSEAPDDGSAFNKSSCHKRVVRGGSYRLPAEQARAQNRLGVDPVTRSDQIGFRIVEER